MASRLTSGRSAISARARLAAEAIRPCPAWKTRPQAVIHSLNDKSANEHTSGRRPATSAAVAAHRFHSLAWICRSPLAWQAAIHQAISRRIGTGSAPVRSRVPRDPAMNTPASAGSAGSSTAAANAAGRPPASAALCARRPGAPACRGVLICGGSPIGAVFVQPAPA